MGFNVWSIDIKQAYLQSASQLRRDLFEKPTEVSLIQNELPQIVKPHYGLSDSEDC